MRQLKALSAYVRRSASSMPEKYMPSGKKGRPFTSKRQCSSMRHVRASTSPGSTTRKPNSFSPRGDPSRVVAFSLAV